MGNLFEIERHRSPIRMKVNRINLQQFLGFCKQFALFSGISNISESPAHRKSNRLIYQFVFLMCVYGKSCFLAMDQSGRLGKLKQLFKLKRFSNRRYRHTVVSDTTLIRRLPDIDSSEIRRINYQTLLIGIKRKWIQPIAIIDGTYWGAAMYSCLCFITYRGDVWMVDFERIEEKGKELAASRRLIERCCQMIGKGVIHLLLADMLYFNEGFWQLRNNGYVKDILIKYTPGTDDLLSEPYRVVLQTFMEMKRLYEKPEKSKKDKQKLYHMGFERREGYDDRRGVSYVVYRQRNNPRDNRWQMALVFEKNNAGDPLPPFYVITTCKSMGAKALCENGHQRWYIENDGFKMLNAHLNSKRKWNEDEAVVQNLIYIWLLAFSLLCLFRREYQHIIRKLYNGVKETYAFVSYLLEMEAFGRIRLDGI